MCKKVVAFHNGHRANINHIEGLGLLFGDLQMRSIHLDHEREHAANQYLPFLKEKKTGLKNLEKIYNKFSTALNGYLSSLHVKGKHRKSEFLPLIAFSHLSAEQYPGILARMRMFNQKLLPFGIEEEDFQSLEKQLTTFILSMPMQTIMEEQIEDLHTAENLAISDMQYLLTRQIDPLMETMKHPDPEVYTSYLDARNLTGTIKREGPDERMNTFISPQAN